MAEPITPPGFVPPPPPVVVKSVHEAFVREQLAEQFKRHCLVLCPYCRGEQPDTDPKPVRVTDYARARGDLVPAYVHLLTNGNRVLCGANALRLAEDAQAEPQQPRLLDTSQDWNTAAKKAVGRLAERRAAEGKR